MVAVRVAGKRRAKRNDRCCGCRTRRVSGRIDKQLRLLQQLRIQHTVIKRRVILGAVQRFTDEGSAVSSRPGQRQLLLFSGEALQLFQQVGAANQNPQAGRQAKPSARALRGR